MRQFLKALWAKKKLLRCVGRVQAKKKHLHFCKCFYFVGFDGGTCGGRTHDKRIKSVDAV